MKNMISYLSIKKKEKIMNKKRKNSIMQSLPYLILVIVICSVLFVYSGGKSNVHDLKTGEID